MTQETIGEIACGLYLVVFVGYLWYIDRVEKKGIEEVAKAVAEKMKNYMDTHGIK